MARSSPVILTNWWPVRRRRRRSADAAALARRAGSVDSRRSASDADAGSRGLVGARGVSARCGLWLLAALVFVLMQGWRFSRARRGPFDER